MNTMTYEQALAFKARHDREAEQLSTGCPICGKDSKVLAQFKQATRREPIRFLGYQGLCIPCQMAFTPNTFQTRLEA